MLSNEISKMEKILEKPYFGKIVIGAPNSIETYYIGKYGFNCDNGQIISWLAPVANIYYSKKGAYSLSDGKEITVELHLVRTLEIEKDVLLDIHEDFIKDKQIRYQDPFLLRQLKRFSTTN